MAAAVDDLSYGDGYFAFTFKDGTVLHLASDGSFEHIGGQPTSECTTVTTHQPPPVMARKPDFSDSTEAHVLTACLAAPATAHVVLRGLLALRRERNRSIEARQINRAAGLGALEEDRKRISP